MMVPFNATDPRLFFSPNTRQKGSHSIDNTFFFSFFSLTSPKRDPLWVRQKRRGGESAVRGNPTKASSVSLVPCPKQRKKKKRKARAHISCEDRGGLGPGRSRDDAVAYRRPSLQCTRRFDWILKCTAWCIVQQESKEKGEKKKRKRKKSACGMACV